MNRDFDVLVVGGGPAGLSAAAYAASAGARVAVFEKSKEIGYPVHTSGGSWIVDMQRLGIPQEFMTPVYSGVFCSPGARAEVSFDNPPSCILDVRGLYQYLAAEASAAGVRVVVDTTVQQAVLNGGGIKGLRTRRQGRETIFSAPLVIDASGANSLIARQVGLHNGFARVGVGAEYDLYAPEWPRGRVAFLFGSQIAPGGYGWIFPHQKHRLRVGIGSIRPDHDVDPRRLLDQLLRDKLCFQKELSRVSQLEYHTGIIPSDACLKKSYSDGLLVVGDAGAMISTLLGEGIRFAIEIGRLAGETAGKAVAARRYDAEFLRDFERRWRHRFYRIFQAGVQINRRLAAYRDAQWDEKVRIISSMAPGDLVALLRGEINMALLLRLSLHAPGLVATKAATALKRLLN